MENTGNMERLLDSIIATENVLIVQILRGFVGVKRKIRSHRRFPILDIQGEPSTDNPKVLGLDDVIDFGKYKGVTIREVIEKDWHYIEWAVLQSQRLYVDVEAVVNYHESCIVSLKPSDIMQFGKYKGQSLASVYATDAQYLRWLESNNDSFRIDWDSFQAQIQNSKDE